METHQDIYESYQEPMPEKFMAWIFLNFLLVSLNLHKTIISLEYVKNVMLRFCIYWRVMSVGYYPRYCQTKDRCFKNGILLTNDRGRDFFLL